MIVISNQNLIKLAQSMLTTPSSSSYRTSSSASSSHSPSSSARVPQQQRNLSFMEAFREADEVLHQGVRTITDLIVQPGLINLDFGDVRTVLLSNRHPDWDESNANPDENAQRIGKALMGKKTKKQ